MSQTTSGVRLAWLVSPQAGQLGLCGGAPGIPWRRNPQVLLQMSHRLFTPAILEQNIRSQQMRLGNLRGSALEMFQGFPRAAMLRHQTGGENQVEAGMSRIDVQASTRRFSGLTIPVHTNECDAEIRQCQAVPG